MHAAGWRAVKHDLSLSRKRALRTLYSNISRRLSTHAADRAPRSAIHSAFLSVHFALAYRAAFRRTHYHAVERNLALSFYTQAGVFYSGRRIMATFYAR